VHVVAPRALLAKVGDPYVLFVAALCALLGLVRSLDPESGGAPRSVAAYFASFRVAACIVLPTFCMVVVMARLAPRRAMPRGALLIASVVVGIAVGCCLIVGSESLPQWSTYPYVFYESLMGTLPVGLLALGILLIHERDKRTQRELVEERIRQIDIERQSSEAQLQALQSQIAPHFLFNTLAHVRRLYVTAPEEAREMLRDLTRYLGTVRPALMRRAISLEEDLELGRAYLNIQRRRMGVRLRLIVEVAPAVRDVLTPPMTITTLAENAIKHGLSPLPGGGTIEIRAVAAGDEVRVEVSDTGVGIRGNLGSGIGLANIRSRLLLLYGARAALTLMHNHPTGVTAAVTLPYA
jgi:sensor histidine kinase YesM